MLPLDVAQANTDPLLGRPLGGGRFVVVGRLGRGGFGTVYRAVQRAIDREVAIKVIRLGGEDPLGDLRERFLQEARAIGGLAHSATVTLHDYGVEDDGLMYMALELVEGETLQRVLRDGRLPPKRALAIARQVLESLAEAHAKGLVHRDVKPANVMLQTDHLGREQVKVLDFGIAKVLGGDDPQREIIETQGNNVIGSPRFMAPEQVRRQPLGPFTDVYSVGVVLFQMLNGRPPFDGASGFDLMRAHVSEPVPEMDEDLPISPDVRALVRRALAKDPSGRFPDAAAMLGALGTPVEAPSAPLSTAAPLADDEIGSTSRMLSGELVASEGGTHWPWVAGAVLLLLGSFVGVSLMLRAEPPAPEPPVEPVRVTPAAAPPPLEEPPAVLPPVVAPQPPDAAPPAPDAGGDAAPPVQRKPKRRARRKGRGEPSLEIPEW